ncbi:tetratricopeptide repeat protein [Tranquillimonas alkanivorans]|uniref:TPR repeat-containing protein n=1 Tax=Tranquillimonas alkanivorans TaxID=441119 RepID=A0A1I5SKT1_9RHOB|nr:tetratricopeptide repeat protein [Tranquillimonas alkanivorans]SFP71328.1 TPR repeat-containing protein [Tranquillimonas alkanivorans]
MRLLKHAVTSLLIALPLSAAAQEQDLSDLYAALREAGPEEAQQIERKIWEEWSRSGSPSMDLLLQRGQEALEAGDAGRAIEHFSALIDHAPGFAEGYNARATAYYAADRYGQSLDDLRMALALNPNHFGAMTGLALILTEIGRDQDALEVWRRVREMNPQQDGLDSRIEMLEREVEGRTL